MPKKKSSKSSYPSVAGPSKSEQLKWQTEDDLRTLRRAREIEMDRARMGRVQKMAQQEVKIVSSLAKPTSQPKRKKF